MLPRARSSQIQEAISYFSRSGRYNHAVRLAKEHGLDRELMSFALQASAAVMIDCAEYFERKGEVERAVSLFQKGGNIAKALDLCFRSQLFEVLRNIADELGPSTDAAILAQCADFFTRHSQFEKAVHLLLMARRFDAAIELAVSQMVKITDEMAERMAPEKAPAADGAGGGGAERDDPRRLALLLKVAKACRQQGSFHLATRKYTQAGDRVKAMKCLLKSGDTEKVIFFANVSRTREIYVLAANYLQALDWHAEPEVMRSIITFYTKAKAFDALAAFYDACAQVEMDEYRDYEKALGALREAEKYALKAEAGGAGAGGGKTGEGSASHVGLLRQRIQLVDKFVGARTLSKSDPNEMVRLCLALLEQPAVETAIRIGDCFALLVEHFYTQNKLDQVRRLLNTVRPSRDARKRGVGTGPCERGVCAGPLMIVVSPLRPRAGVQTDREDAGAAHHPEPVSGSGHGERGVPGDGRVADCRRGQQPRGR